MTDNLDDRPKCHTGTDRANYASLCGVMYRIEVFASGDGLAVSVKVWCVSCGEGTCKAVGHRSNIRVNNVSWLGLNLASKP